MQLEGHRVQACDVDTVCRGRVRYAPLKSLWFLGMLSAALVGGALTFSWGAVALFVFSTVVVLPNSDLVVGGGFWQIGTTTSLHNEARWSGSTWSALGTGFDYEIRALAMLGNGVMVAGGDFRSTGVGLGRSLAQWDGASWAEFGGGTDNSVWSLLTLSNGDLVAGGNFTAAGGIAARSIARWNGTTWSPFGAGMFQSSGSSGFVHSLTQLADGTIVAGGYFAQAGGDGA